MLEGEELVAHNVDMRQDRFGLQDTGYAVERKMIELLRAKTPEQRLRMTIQRMELMRTMRRQTEQLRGDRPDGPR